MGFLGSYTRMQSRQPHIKEDLLMKQYIRGQSADISNDMVEWFCISISNQPTNANLHSLQRVAAVF